MGKLIQIFFAAVMVGGGLSAVPGAAFRALSSAVARVRLVSDRRLLRRTGEP
jgi:hypothetical protein